MHGVFPGREGALAAMVGEVGFSTSWEVFLPCRLKARTRLFKARRVAGTRSAAVVDRIEADIPAPLPGVSRQPRLDRDRSDLNVTVKDVPAVGAFGVRTAGEGGHALLKRGLAGFGKLSIGGGRSAAQLQRVGLRKGLASASTDLCIHKTASAIQWSFRSEWNVATPHLLTWYGTPTQSNSSVGTWLRRRGGLDCDSPLQRQLGTVALTVEGATMREPLDIILGSIVLGFLFFVMISGSLAAIFIYSVRW